MAPGEEVCKFSALIPLFGYLSAVAIIERIGFCSAAFRFYRGNGYCDLLLEKFLRMIIGFCVG